jgi:DNA replication and repair protein RecF
VRADRLRLVDYRSYRDKEISPADVTLLVGPNASGKTNLIEAVRAATATTSFRTSSWKDVVRWGADRARVEVDASGESTHTEIVLDVRSDGRRVYRVNGSLKRRHGDVAGIVPSVVFTPDDLQILKGSPDARRSALDDMGAAAARAYGVAQSDYAKVLRQRNRALKDQATDALLASLTDQAAGAGARLLSLRTRLLWRIRPFFVEAHETISDGEEADVSYADRSGLEPEQWREGVGREEARQALATQMEQRAREERARGMTLAGPHRDDVVFTVGRRDARSFASQGQQRSLTLAWKIAELRALQEITGRRPILLLDDVMSELDRRRRSALAALVGEASQTLITTTNLGYFGKETLDAADVVELP